MLKRPSACADRLRCHIHGSGPQTWSTGRAAHRTDVIGRCRDTGLYVGDVPGFAGAHSSP